MKRAPVRISVSAPSTEEARRQLADRVAHVHADLILAEVKSLPCPPEQKLALIDSILEKLRAETGA